MELGSTCRLIATCFDAVYDAELSGKTDMRMKLRTKNPNYISLVLILTIVCLGLMWIVISTYAIPPLIKSAYHGESLPVFNKMVSGQRSHLLGEYLSDWEKLRWRMLVGFSVFGLLAVVLIRPEFQRPLWVPAVPQGSAAEVAEDKASSPFRASLRRRLVILPVIALAGIGTARIVSTYHVFSQTVDEPAQVAAGMEWLDLHTYNVDPSHPPLARVAIALGPFLSGLRMPPEVTNWVDTGNQILYAKGQYSHNLALARLGVLPFFFLATVVVWVWSRKVFGDTTALLATLLFTTLPPVLAHAGLATTDMALAATFMTAMLAFLYLLECPTYFRSCVLGFTVALAILSKFSALLFLPACGLVILVCRWSAKRRRTEILTVPWGRRAIAIALTMITALLIIWSGYRFSFQSYKPEGRAHENMEQSAAADGIWRRLPHVVAEHAPIPAPALLEGINFQRKHAAKGHVSYLLGQMRYTGWWYYFPVALGVKSPVPFLILSGIGIATLFRQWWRADWRALAPAAMAVTLLVVCMPSRINIGLRHILPIYPLLAIVAGFGASRLWNFTQPKRVGPAVVVILVLWQLIASARIHPDYLAYFNELVGRHPERVLVVTDLDWGQDLLRLANVLQAQKIDSLMLAYWGTAEPSRHHLPQWRNLEPCQPATGWIGISVQTLKIGLVKRPSRGYAWLENFQPRTTAGKSIRLYYIPENTSIPNRNGEPPMEGCR